MALSVKVTLSIMAVSVTVIQKKKKFCTHKINAINITHFHVSQRSKWTNTIADSTKKTKLLDNDEMLLAQYDVTVSVTILLIIWQQKQKLNRVRAGDSNSVCPLA